MNLSTASIDCFTFTSRGEKLVSELRYAYDTAPREVIATWCSKSTKRLGKVLLRRGKNLWRLGVGIVKGVHDESVSFVETVRCGESKADHVKARLSVGKKNLAEAARAARYSAGALYKALIENPREVGPNLLVAALAFQMAGGGVDGDGGVPDIDIAVFGIGGHRSILTHSVLSGAVIEASLFALVDIVAMTYEYLPPDCDEIWELILARSEQLSRTAVIGASLGIATHLAADSILQPGSYRDLPFSAPHEIHSAIAGVNSSMEGIDVRNKDIRATPRNRRAL
jgi:hypothetical protein